MINDEPLLIFCTCPDRQAAEKLARHLVQSRLVACVNVLHGARSFFYWQGQMEVADETVLLMKSTAKAQERLQEVIRKEHEYEVPEVIAVPIVAGLPAYLQWLVDSVEKPE